MHLSTFEALLNMKETNTNATANVTEKDLKAGKANTNGKKDLATLDKKKEKAIEAEETISEEKKAFEESIIVKKDEERERILELQKISP